MLWVAASRGGQGQEQAVKGRGASAQEVDKGIRPCIAAHASQPTAPPVNNQCARTCSDLVILQQQLHQRLHVAHAGRRGQVGLQGRVGGEWGRSAS